MRKESLNIEADRNSLRTLLATAAAFDLERDGLYDARFGLINVWCSPDDKPALWTTPINRAALTHPRAYVGALGWDWLDDDRVALHVEADPYDLLDRRPRRPLSDAEWVDVLGWLHRQALALVRLAALAPRVVGTRCPLCPFVLPAGELLNGLLDHIAGQHPAVRLRGIGTGDAPALRTDLGDLPLRPVEEFD